LTGVKNFFSQWRSIHINNKRQKNLPANLIEEMRMSNRTNTPATRRGKPEVKMPLVTPPIQNKTTASGAHLEAPKKSTPATPPLERHLLIAQAAYYIAERRGFAPGNELEDWFQAEGEVEAREAGALQ
jgi:hypothetical protein